MFNGKSCNTSRLNGKFYRPGTHVLICKSSKTLCAAHIWSNPKLKFAICTDNSALTKMETSSDIIRQCTQCLLQAAAEIAVLTSAQSVPEASENAGNNTPYQLAQAPPRPATATTSTNIKEHCQLFSLVNFVV